VKIIGTDECYRWLHDKPVKPEFRARIAATMATIIAWDKLEIEAAYEYWRNKRPDFFNGE
jgi:hypothetical protein